MINKTFLDGYLQALLDVEEGVKFGSAYQQYYRNKTFSLTNSLREKMSEDYQNGE